MWLMDPLLSPKQIAEAIGASESSVKRWCDQGLLQTVRTAGGHRRISVQEALRFVRDRNQQLVEPRILALPATDDRKSRRIEGCAVRFMDALLSDNELAAQAIVLDLFAAGHPVSQIFDEVIAVAFHGIGEKWACHAIEVYEERCSCQITMRVLNDLRARQVTPEGGRTALGATIEHDQYALPVMMAEIVLRSVGWDARLLGASIPFDSMAAAIRSHQPGLFWLSVSHIEDEGRFVPAFNALCEAGGRVGTAIVCGGRALTAEIRSKLRYSSYCDTMRHLEGFARTVARCPQGPENKSARSKKA
jgi:MerR family transcriptional regulator, light-induced transcriptional regulator